MRQRTAPFKAFVKQDKRSPLKGKLKPFFYFQAA